MFRAADEGVPAKGEGRRGCLQRCLDREGPDKLHWVENVNSHGAHPSAQASIAAWTSNVPSALVPAKFDARAYRAVQAHM